MDLTTTWRMTVREILAEGLDVSPRGQLTKEIPQKTTRLDMRYPVLCIPARKLNYKFMAAEAYWILSGDNRVDSISPYNKNIAQFSDNGVTFFGAYGPKIASQLDYVVNKLAADRDTRQAGLTIWRENPPATKDVPCTVAVFFNIRTNLLGMYFLNCHVFMRSSDAWLGLPYDAFNFSMLSHMVCCRLNAMSHDKKDRITDVVLPGELHLTAASSHLYERDWDAARKCLSASSNQQNATPQFTFYNEKDLMVLLNQLRTSTPGDKIRWWYA